LLPLNRCLEGGTLWGEKQTPELADFVARAGAPERAELGDGGAGLVDAAEHLG
jgi:hypothetical protein